jgi:hypothetical protein
MIEWKENCFEVENLVFQYELVILNNLGQNQNQIVTEYLLRAVH